MQTLHNHIRSKHHAKHTGRMQYGLFLKGIGVSLEESLKFWRTEFCKGGMDTDKVRVVFHLLFILRYCLGVAAT